MTTPVGGLRHRLIRDSLFHMVHDSLNALHWFDTGRPYAPITFRYGTYNHQESIDVNTLALADETHSDVDIELGTLLSEHRWVCYLDFFGDSDALALHIIGDVKDILEGRFPSIGRGTPNFIAYDYTHATPPPFATIEIEGCVIDRAREFHKPWEEHWYSCQFQLVDYYGDESG